MRRFPWLLLWVLLVPNVASASTEGGVLRPVTGAEAEGDRALMAVPEPGTLLLSSAGLAGLAWLGRPRRG